MIIANHRIYIIAFISSFAVMGCGNTHQAIVSDEEIAAGGEAPAMTDVKASVADADTETIEEVFTPHPLLPLDGWDADKPASIESGMPQDNSTEEVQLGAGASFLYDLGVEIRPAENLEAEGVKPDTDKPISKPVLNALGAKTDDETTDGNEPGGGNKAGSMGWQVAKGAGEDVLPPEVAFSTARKNQDPKVETAVPGTQEAPITDNEVENIRKRLLFIENNIKGDVASLKSENLKLKNRLWALENKVKSNKANPHESGKRKPVTSLAGRQKSASGKSTVKANSFKGRYNYALEMYKRREYATAIDEFKKLIEIDRGHSLSDNSQYWMGECYYQLGDYRQAIIEFNEAMRYPNSNKSDAALVMKGMSYKMLGKTVKAAEQFRIVLTQYPDSGFRNRAEREIRKLQKI